MKLMNGYKIYIIAIFLIATCQANEDCSAKLSNVKGEIAEAFSKHPNNPEPFVCQLAMCLDNPNVDDPSYYNCVIKLLYKQIKVEPEGMRNQENYEKMVNEVKNKKFARGLFECSSLISSCVDVELVYVCLKSSKHWYRD